jgi:hypothetical protein
MGRHVRRAFTVLELLIVFVVVFVLLLGIPMAFWTQRNLEFWGGHFSGNVVDINWWLCFLANLLGPIVFVGNLIGEIARAFV